jgi:ubiquinone/menaquinone biosynthesis C-methylase UbiE
VPEVSVGEHFERVATVYESLRTTDEAPVRKICQLLPNHPVTGLDIGCGTGRYTQLLRALLPGGSLLVAGDVSAAMLAQLKGANCGHAGGVVPLLAAAEQLPLRDASLDVVTAFNCVHDFDLGRFLTSVARALAPGGQLFIYTRTPQQNARTIWGRYFRGFTEHEQRLHSQAAIRDAVSRTGGLKMVATQTFQHPRTSTAGRLRARPRGATTRHSPSTPRRSCARPSRPSWPGCPVPRSAGLTSTSWSSSVGAAATRWGPTVRAAGRTRRSRIRPSQISAGRVSQAPRGVVAVARRSPRYAPSRLLATIFGRAPRSAARRAFSTPRWVGRARW